VYASPQQYLSLANFPQENQIARNFQHDGLPFLRLFLSPLPLCREYLTRHYSEQFLLPLHLLQSWLLWHPLLQFPVTGYHRHRPLLQVVLADQYDHENLRGGLGESKKDVKTSSIESQENHVGYAF